MKKSLFILSILFASLSVAQSKEERANDFFDDFKFSEAIKVYTSIASEKKKPSLDVIQHLADSYFNINDYQNAEQWYSKLYAIKGKQIGESNLIKLVQSLKASMQVEKADELLKEYYTNPTKLKMIMLQKAYLDSISKTKPKYTIKNMPFNSQKSDFAPAMYSRGLVFASARDTAKSSKLYPWNKQPYLDLYFTNPKQEDFVPEKFLENMESTFHDATIAISNDGRTVYFTRNFIKKNKLNANADGLSNMQILKGTIADNKLINLMSLSFNSKNYSCGHPALSADGKSLWWLWR